MTGLPPELRARPALALTRAVETIPGPSALRGGCQYEPKWDGFRVAIVRDETTTTAWSRRGADLSAVFPDLVAAATDLEQAKAWFTDFTEAGLEGLVVKGLGVPYPAGRREWLKVKHRATLDVVCAAIVGPVGRPRALVIGLPSAAGLEIVGRTGVLSARVSAQVGALLRPAPLLNRQPAPV